MAPKKKDDNKISMITQVTSSNLDQEVKEKLISNMITSANKSGDDSMLDKIFGKEHPELYIALFIGILIIIAGVMCTCIFMENADVVKELWKIFVPALTLVIGYVLGNK